MPDLARLSDTAETDIVLMRIGALPTDLLGMRVLDLPHEITTRLARAERDKVEQLATVKRARVFDFNPDLIPLVVPSWIETTLDRLSEIASSEADWDGYGAPRVHPGAMVGALMFLHHVATHLGSRPAIVATGSGNVQFEWRDSGYSIDVEIGAQNEYCATLFVGDTETNEWIGNLSSGVDPELANVIAFGWRGQTS